MWPAKFFLHMAGSSGSQAPPPQEALASFTWTQRPSWNKKTVCLYQFRRIFFLFSLHVSEWLSHRAKCDRLPRQGYTSAAWRFRSGRQSGRWSDARRVFRSSLTASGVVIHLRRLPHVVTGPDGPAAAQETLGRVCETPTDKHNGNKGSQECRQNSNLLLITYLFFTFVRVWQEDGFLRKRRLLWGAAGGDDDDNTSSIRRDNFFFSKLHFTEFLFPWRGELDKVNRISFSFLSLLWTLFEHVSMIHINLQRPPLRFHSTGTK